MLVWSGVALPCLCGGSRRRVSSFERERERRRHFSSVGRSLAPLVCKKRRVCIRTNRHGNYDYVLRDRPRLRPLPGDGHSSPLRGVSVKAALFRRVPGIFHCPAALEPHRSLAAVRVVPWYHWIGGRESWYRKWPPEISNCSGCRERSSSALLPCRCVPPHLSRNRNQAALAPFEST